MTTGGLGVAFFAPFHNERYFFPFRPIKVSPIGIASFFSEWGIRVLKSEFIWVWLPSLVVMGVVEVVKRIRKNSLIIGARCYPALLVLLRTTCDLPVVTLLYK